MPVDADPRPRVLLITRNLPPLVGGMERLLHEATLGIADYANVIVVGPRGCRDVLPAEIDVHEAPAGLLPFLVIALCKALRAALDRSIQIVAGGSGITAPIVYLAAMLCRANTLVFVHGLDIVVPHPAYRAVFLPFVRHIDTIIANSENTRRLAASIGVHSNRITVVNPGTGLPPVAREEEIEGFRQSHGIRFARFMVFVGRQTRRKGLSGFLEHCLPRILQRNPDLGLVVVGADPRDSLNRLGEQDAILDVIHSTGLGDYVQFLGVVDDATLRLCYASAAVQVFPLIDVPGDVEGFGMVAVEAAANGTPTVAFDLGGVADAIAADNGTLVTPGDYGQFADAVLAIIESYAPTPEQCRQHAQKYGWVHYNAALRPHFLPGEPAVGPGA